MSSRKGVSPLIATVILIAFVIAVAAIASQFITSFTQERQAQFGEEGEAVVDCGFASFEIDEDTINYDSANNDLTLTIENTGRTALAIEEIVHSNTSTDIREVVLATRKSDDTEITTSNPLDSGDILTIHNDTVTTLPDDIVVRSSCPGVTAAVTNDTDTNEWKQVFG